MKALFLGNVAVDARRFRADALNQERFSSEEYISVRSRVYQAAGVAASDFVDFQKIAEAVRNGTGIDVASPPGTPALKVIDVPEKNRELVKPYLNRIDEWLPLLFFGL